MGTKDADLDVRADGLGRRGEIGRRAFVRAGVIGAALSSAAVMQADPAAGVATMARRVSTARVAKASGLVKAGPELGLPPGFSYHTFGNFGSAMSDGFITPPIHDGMAAFDMGNGRLRIIRNHELGEGNDIPPGTVIGNPKTAYDRKAPGGTVTLEVDAVTGELIKDWVSLNGTDTNCAGIKTPWNTWLTCEETTIGVDAGYNKPHGYVFEVDPKNNRAVRTRPFKGMGRFLHEAGAVDPGTGVIYMTEDEGPDGFYRFVPDRPGGMRKGQLQMLRVDRRTVRAALTSGPFAILGAPDGVEDDRQDEHERRAAQHDPRADHEIRRVPRDQHRARGDARDGGDGEPPHDRVYWPGGTGRGSGSGPGRAPVAPARGTAVWRRVCNGQVMAQSLRRGW